MPVELEDLVLPGSAITELGQGFGGGTVYLIKPARGHSYVLKRYYESGQLQKDLRLMSLLRQMMIEVSSSGRETFKVARSIERSKRVMELEYVPGQTLRYLLSRFSPLGDRQKEQLEEKYERALAALHDTLKLHFPTAQVAENAPWRWTFETSEYGREQIFIHDGNIIVDPRTLEFTIIDPF